LLTRRVLIGRSWHGLGRKVRGGLLVLGRLHGRNVVLRLRHEALSSRRGHGVRRRAAGDRQVLELGLRWHLWRMVRRLLLLGLLCWRVGTQRRLAVRRLLLLLLLLCRCMLLGNLGVTWVLCVRLLLSDCVLVVLRCCRRPLGPVGRCIVRQASSVASSRVDVARNRCDALGAFVGPPSSNARCCGSGYREWEVRKTTVASARRLLLLRRPRA